MINIKWSETRKIATNEWVPKAEAEFRVRFLQVCLIGGAVVTSLIHAFN